VRDELILEALGVCRYFRTRRKGLRGASRDTIKAVDGVDLAIPAGRSIGLVGESGCGKSTLSRLLLMLDAPTGGEVHYRGRRTSALTRREIAEFRADIQPVFQDPFQSLDPKMSVGRIVAEPLRAQGRFTRAEIRGRVGDALERVELRRGDGDRKPIDFSGGQRQRIAIARALVSAPRLLVLDEPVSSQDVSIRAQILNLLKDIQDESQIAFLFISHDLSTVRFLCDSVYVMRRGKIVESGRAEDVFSAPSHPYTQALLASWLPPDPALARRRREENAHRKQSDIT
jgi:peptide/nickel transport system ATP-binding protein